MRTLTVAEVGELAHSNTAPTATLSEEYIQTYIGQQLVLDGSASSDPDGDALTFSWAENPLNPVQGLLDSTAPSPVAAFTVPGIYEYTLTVSDGALTDSASVVVDVLGIDGLLDGGGEFQASLTKMPLDLDASIRDLLSDGAGSLTAIVSIRNKIEAIKNHVDAQAGKKIDTATVLLLIPMLEVHAEMIEGLQEALDEIEMVISANRELLELGGKVHHTLEVTATVAEPILSYLYGVAGSHLLLVYIPTILETVEMLPGSGVTCAGILLKSEGMNVCMSGDL